MTRCWPHPLRPPRLHINPLRVQKNPICFNGNPKLCVLTGGCEQKAKSFLLFLLFIILLLQVCLTETPDGGYEAPPTFCPAITTHWPSRSPMPASCALALSERGGGAWGCSERGRGEPGRGKACLSSKRSSLAVAADSAISKDTSRGSGTTSAGLWPFSFCTRKQHSRQSVDGNISRQCRGPGNIRH